jgi:hypothetical protein
VLDRLSLQSALIALQKSHFIISNVVKYGMLIWHHER